MSRNVGDNLDHLTLHISSEMLDNAFKCNLVTYGCFGAVYRVPYDGVFCAAKDQCRCDHNLYKIEYFQQECLLHSKLRHPNIVQMLGVCYHNNSLHQPIKVMELLGCKISSIINSVSMYVKLALMQDVSSGLAYLHDHTRNPPIIHSCLTMEVIFLTANLVAKIGGFTFSVEVVPETKRLPEPTTFSVDSDEILKSSQYCGLPFDIYSIGCVMCEIITGKHFYGHTYFHNPIGKALTLHFVKFGQYELKYYINRITDTSLKQLVMDCTNDNPDHRPSASLINEIITNMIKSKFL